MSRTYPEFPYSELSDLSNVLFRREPEEEEDEEEEDDDKDDNDDDEEEEEDENDGYSARPLFIA